MTETPTSALRILVSAESTADAPAALKLATILASGGPAQFGGLLVVSRALEPEQLLASQRIVTTGGTLIDTPERARLKRIFDSEIQSFRKMVSEMAGAMGAAWSANVAQGPLESELTASAGDWDIVVVGHRALHQRRGAVVVLRSAASKDDLLGAVSRRISAELRSGIETLQLPDDSKSEWFVNRLNRMNAAAVILDAATGMFDDFRHIAELLTVARCPIVILRNTQVQPQLEHSNADPAPPETGR